MDRLKTYVEGFDEALGGGIPRGSLVLVAGDSLAALYSLSHLNNPRRELFHFFGFLKSLHATCFLISEVPSGNPGKLSSFEEEFLADGILYLGQVERGAADVQLRLRCVKMRRARHERGYYA